MKRCLIVLAALLAALLGCDANEPRVSARLIIIGFDGMDPKLAQQWMNDGSLPNFSRLAAKGSFEPLATSNPPQSPVAWSGFATGLQPGGHGIYDFLRRDPLTYLPAFSISETKMPEEYLSLFGMELPLDEPIIINRRQGSPFWMDIEAEGGASHRFAGTGNFSARPYPTHAGRNGCARHAGHSGNVHAIQHAAVGWFHDQIYAHCAPATES